MRSRDDLKIFNADKELWPFLRFLQESLPTLKSLSTGWTYAGYKISVFATSEEKQIEGKAQLGGQVLFYPDAALVAAGATIQNGADWQPNVVVDRELITGQQPLSADAFGKVLMAKLAAQAN